MSYHILDRPLQIGTLASLALQMIDDKSQPLVSRDIDKLQEVYKEALPKAYALLETTKAFWQEKEKEKEAKKAEYVSSPEGLARIQEMRRRRDK